MKTLLIGLFSLCCFEATAQVEIIKDSRIDGLVKSQSQIIPPATVPQIMGYRLQVTFDSEKSVIDEARAKFIAAYPKVDTYVEFVAPHYFLKIGDFRTQMEAEGVKASMQGQFPTCFIVKERINLPRIDQ
jgi:hypothetical protein